MLWVERGLLAFKLHLEASNHSRSRYVLLVKCSKQSLIWGLMMLCIIIFPSLILFNPKLLMSWHQTGLQNCCDLSRTRLSIDGHLPGQATVSDNAISKWFSATYYSSQACLINGKRQQVVILNMNQVYLTWQINNFWALVVMLQVTTYSGFTQQLPTASDAAWMQDTTDDGDTGKKDSTSMSRVASLEVAQSKPSITAEDHSSTVMVLEYADRGTLDKAMTTGRFVSKTTGELDVVKTAFIFFSKASPLLHGVLQMGWLQ